MASCEIKPAGHVIPIISPGLRYGGTVKAEVSSKGSFVNDKDGMEKALVINERNAFLCIFKSKKKSVIQVKLPVLSNWGFHTTSHR